MAILKSIDRATKWWVSAAVAIITISFSNETTAVVPFYVTGALVTAAFAKLLKKLINQSRPTTSKKIDPGMPSSHATCSSFLFLSAASSLALKLHDRPVLALASFGCVEGVGVLLSVLRILNGEHTAAQVVVGYCIGTISFASLFVVERFVLGGVDNALGPAGRSTVTLVCLVCAIIFTAKYVRKWF